MDFENFMQDLNETPLSQRGKAAYKNVKKLQNLIDDMQALKDVSEKTTGEINVIHPVNIIGSLALMVAVPNGAMEQLFVTNVHGEEERDSMDRLPVSVDVTDDGVSIVWHNEDTDEYYIVTGHSDFTFSARYLRKGKVIRTWNDRPLHDHVRAVWQMTNTPRAYR